jgi:hypothetical protein
MLDPVHMLKLARNALATLRTIRSADGVISYHYLEQLVKLQEDIGLHFANKLSRRHLNWFNMKMKVKLAAELLSSSVADALQYLSTFHHDFRDASATILFIRNVSTGICWHHYALYGRF